jgi:hypothetical protein
LDISETNKEDEVTKKKQPSHLVGEEIASDKEIKSREKENIVRALNQCGGKIY